MKKHLVSWSLLFSSICFTSFAATQLCDQYSMLQLGGYLYENCVWNPQGGFDQCVTVNGDANNSWSVTWQMAANVFVQSYPNINVTRQTNSSVPFQVSALKPTYASWTIDTIGGIGQFTAAWDLFTYPSSTSSTRMLEIMIWIFRFRNAVGPAGAIKDTVALEGANWFVWGGTMNGWKICSFVRTTNLPLDAQGRMVVKQMNLTPFVKYCLDNGYTTSSQWVGYFGAGHEIGGGHGYARTSFYKLEQNIIVDVKQTEGISKNIDRSATAPYVVYMGDPASARLDKKSSNNKMQADAIFDMRGKAITRPGHTNGVYFLAR